MDKSMTDAILRILISDLTEIPPDRLEALARRIVHVVSGASMVPLLGAEYVSRMKQSEALEEQADFEAARGNIGLAFRLNNQAFDLALESMRDGIA